MLKKFLSLKLVFLAIIVVGLVLYFKPSETKKNSVEKDLAQPKSSMKGISRMFSYLVRKINLF